MTDSADDARRYSLRLLGYKGRSERELREKLARKGYPEDTISVTLGYLKRVGYLDDHELAGNLRRQAVDNKMLGYRAAKRFIAERGIPQEIVEDTITYDEETEIRNISRLVEKKLRTMQSPIGEKEARRLHDFLARRGFSTGLIRKALRDIKEIREDV